MTVHSFIKDHNLTREESILIIEYLALIRYRETMILIKETK